jgi:CNT family concentrative nucleoside transporter
MDRFQGLFGVILILGIAFLCSNNKKRINYRLVVSGIALQITIAILVLKVAFITNFFKWIGHQIATLKNLQRKEPHLFMEGFMFRAIRVL